MIHEMFNVEVPSTLKLFNEIILLTSMLAVIKEKLGLKRSSYLFFNFFLN